ncbi:MAG: O-antigen ligase family protein [Burkholderiaceae bacterium]
MKRFVDAWGPVLLTLCWIQFTVVWLWPPSRAFTQEMLSLPQDKPFAAPFQYALWAAIVLTTAHLIRLRGLGFFDDTAFFFPYFMCLLVSSVLGVSVMPSLRLSVLWLLSVLAGALIANVLDQRRLIGVLGALIAATMVASLLMFYVVPDIGSDRYAGAIVLRGLFDNKNQAGRIAGLSLAIIVAFRRDLPASLKYTGLVAATACLILSDSKTALVGAALSSAYLLFVSALRRRMSAGLGGLTLGVALLVLVALAALLGPLLAGAIGRDLTFTGRTEVWSAYLRALEHDPAFGMGPGSYTSVSPLTVPIALKFVSMGAIFSPHNFFIGTLGDLGLPGLACVVCMLLYVAVYLPLHFGDRFAFACAGVGVSTIVQGAGETLDVATGGATWFLLSLFLACHLHERAGTGRFDAVRNPGAVGLRRPSADRAAAREGQEKTLDDLRLEVR